MALNDATATAAPPIPDCWVTAEGDRALQCLGRLDADRDDVVDVWLWFTGTETAVRLTAAERAELARASRSRPLAHTPGAVQARLVRRIGRRRAWSEIDRWGLWSVPVEALESVLARALTRSARTGHRYPIVA
ncbi:MAG: hypothetical protein ACRDYZ_06180 [Acidimicrobiales bacterium]